MKLDFWIYIILFILVPLVNSLLEAKKKKKSKVRQVRPVQQPENTEEWWQEADEKWKDLVSSDSAKSAEIIEPAQEKKKKVQPFLQSKNKNASFMTENYSRFSKPSTQMERQEKDVYDIDKDEPFVVDNSELRKAIVMSEILAKKF